MLVELLGQVCSEMDFQFVQAQHLLLLKLFLSLFEIRYKMEGGEDPALLDKMEIHNIKSFLAISLKLNENTFKPMVIKIVDWVQQTSGDNVSQFV